MSIEVRPNGVQCNIRCTYCYEESMREESKPYRFDMAAVKKSVNLLKPGESFSLFGGEPLLVSLEDLEELLALSVSRTGNSGLQTNGTLITEAHIDLFKKYKTSVGISVDGPDELNDTRFAGTAAATTKLTAKTQWAIDRLCEESKTHPHLLPSIITTLHAGNFSAERFPRLVAWFRDLDAKGVRSVNLHVMEMDHKASEWYLPPIETGERLIELWNLQSSFAQLKFTKFDEVMKLLQGRDDVVCVWHTCDPWNTSAVNGIEGDGTPSHCSRTNKDGVNWLPAEGAGEKNDHTTFIGHAGSRHYERQLGLYVTPQAVGGCQGCEFWLLCFGNCPGTGAESETGTGADWRYRTSYCGLYKTLFHEGERRLESAGIVPFSKWKNRKTLETHHMDNYLKQGRSAGLAQVIQDVSAPGYVTMNAKKNRPFGSHGDVPHGDSGGRGHGDHTDYAMGGACAQAQTLHGDAPHGDAPHGDAPHGDAPHGDA